MTERWADLFDRGSEYDVDLETIRKTHREDKSDD